MTKEIYFPFKSARYTAEKIYYLLLPHCEDGRIHIAGSIRRMRSQVSDIEIVCTPKKEKIFTGLFQEEDHTTSKNFIKALASITQKDITGNVNGRMMKILTSSKACPGIHLDLFMPQPQDYFRQLIIRTGSKEYVQHVIAAAWIRKGWVGVNKLGLRRRTDCINKPSPDGKNNWILSSPLSERRGVGGEAHCETPPAWQSEEEVYQWLGIKYTPPTLREFKKPLYNEAQ